MTLERSKIDSYWKSRTKIRDAQISSRYRADEAPKFDIEFISRYLSQGCEILDLGAGSCILADRLATFSEVKYICAVEKFDEFFKKRPANDKVETRSSDIVTYADHRTFDIVMIFGVMNYFDVPEATRIYSNCLKFLKPNGVLLVKHQCGLSEDVEVDHYSQELEHHYQAIYRSKDHEIKLLEQSFSVEEIVDVYPPKLNRWNNTHFFGFVCRQKKSSMV